MIPNRGLGTEVSWTTFFVLLIIAGMFITLLYKDNAMSRYAKFTPLQKANMNYGCKVRVARGLTATATSYDRGLPTPVFTQEELDILHRISRDAQERAKKELEQEVNKINTEAKPAEVDKWSAPECRQYSGK